jgi:hypothetical protein
MKQEIESKATREIEDLYNFEANPRMSDQQLREKEKNFKDKVL